MPVHYYDPHNLDNRTACGLFAGDFTINGLDWTDQPSEVTCAECLADATFQELEAREQYTSPLTPPAEWGEVEDDGATEEAQ
jgi:hypothetical protein